LKSGFYATYYQSQLCQYRCLQKFFAICTPLLISKALPLGNYTYHEVEAPNGYIKEDTSYEFSIQNHEQIIEMTVYNQKDRIPVTGGMLSNDIMIILIITIISIFGYIIMNTLTNAKEENN